MTRADQFDPRLVCASEPFARVPDLDLDADFDPGLDADFFFGVARERVPRALAPGRAFASCLDRDSVRAAIG